VKTGGGCLYIKSLDDVSVAALRGVIADSIKRVKAKRIDYSK
jgi:hypothetical protein